MTESELMTIPARKGRAVRLSKGQGIKIINTHGQQVVDTWCFVTIRRRPRSGCFLL